MQNKSRRREKEGGHGTERPALDGAGTPASRLAELESVLGHRFREPERLGRALMHSSRVPERAAEDPSGDNEQLEFLGDAVLELIVTDELVRAFPDWTEGQLSKSRARLVKASSLSAAAQGLKLGSYLRLGRGEEKTGGRLKPALLADAYEAVVAALYLDAGLEAARAFVQRSLVSGVIAAEAEGLSHPDHKSALQELLQARGLQPGRYRIVAESGLDHEKTFRVEVCVTGGITGVGTGRTKKEAEQWAAQAALKQLGAAGD
jgi:ribonuclease III